MVGLGARAFEAEQEGFSFSMKKIRRPRKKGRAVVFRWCAFVRWLWHERTA